MISSKQFAWLTNDEKPLDVIARSIELRLAAAGSPVRKHIDASDWAKDPNRDALMLTLFGIRNMGQTPGARTEQYVWVRDDETVYALEPPNEWDDAGYYSRPWFNERGQPFLDDARRFKLCVNETRVRHGALVELLRACAVRLEVNYTATKITLERLTVLPLIRPRFVPCLPLPARSGDPEWRCTASGATWQAMLGVKTAFGGARPPAVLLTGPPGSGKEAYAKAVHYGQRRNYRYRNYSYEDTGRLRTLSLAGATAESLRNVLPKHLDELNDKNGTLFLDEVDKAASSARSYLLRVLENRTYQKKDGSEASCKNVAMVIAAGKPLAHLRGLDPPDFWTRMEVHIGVVDPLTVGSQAERTRLLASFFKFFWWDCINDWLAGYKGGKLSRLSARTISTLEKKMFPVAIGTMNEKEYQFIPSPHVEIIANKFSYVLAPHLERRQLSIRGLRSAVAAIQRATKSQLAAMAHLYTRGAKSDAFNSAAGLFVEFGEIAIYDAVGTVLQVLPDDGGSIRHSNADNISA